jgi:hypothetical protein
MEAKEYRTVDKSEWGSGEWQDEPDKVQFADESTGMPCLIVRNHSGALCGYVGVTEGHPFFGKSYDSSASVPHICDEACDAENDYHSHSSSVGGALSAHGGITFSDFCSSHDEADYQRFMARLEQSRDEAKRYPHGDAAQRLKEWGGIRTSTPGRPGAKPQASATCLAMESPCASGGSDSIAHTPAMSAQHMRSTASAVAAITSRTSLSGTCVTRLRDWRSNWLRYIRTGCTK